MEKFIIKFEQVDNDYVKVFYNDNTFEVIPLKEFKTNLNKMPVSFIVPN